MKDLRGVKGRRGAALRVAAKGAEPHGEDPLRRPGRPPRFGAHLGGEARVGGVEVGDALAHGGVEP